jgi:hypothetical protein
MMIDNVDWFYIAYSIFIENLEFDLYLIDSAPCIKHNIMGNSKSSYAKSILMTRPISDR